MYVLSIKHIVSFTCIQYIYTIIVDTQRDSTPNEITSLA